MKQANQSTVEEKNQSITNQQNTATTMQAVTDIYESMDGVTLYIDLPGVSKNTVELDVDQNVLTVSGHINLDTPEKMHATYMDLRSEQFVRRFTLGEELDSSRITASMEQGQLKLVIPRLEQHKPRKIKVNVA